MTASGVCPSCGADNPRSAYFCASCGEYLDWARPERRPAPAPEPVPPEPAPPVGGPAAPEEPNPAEHDLFEPAPRQVRARRLPTTVRHGDAGRLQPREPAEHAREQPPTHHVTAPVQPQQAAAPARAEGKEPVPRAGPDEPGCLICRRPLVEGRRFCDCGARIGPVEPVRKPERARVPARPRGGRAFLAAMRAADGGRRPRFDRSLSGRTVALRAAGVAAVLVLLLAAFVPATASARAAASAGIQYVLHGPPRPAAVAVAHTRPAPHPGGDPAPAAVDGDASTAWSTWWPRRQPERAEPCTRAVSPSLAIGLAEPGTVDQVALRAGLRRTPDGSWSKQDRPRVVDLLFSDHTCRRVALDDTDATQTFDVDTGTVTDVRVMVVGVYAARSGPGGTVSIAEVRLLRR